MGANRQSAEPAESAAKGNQAAGKRTLIVRPRGMSGYGGPHPPPGKPHHYVFRLYALSQPSGLNQSFTAKDLQRTLKNKVLATGTLTGTYAR